MGAHDIVTRWATALFQQVMMSVVPDQTVRSFLGLLVLRNSDYKNGGAAMGGECSDS